jgi:hypothetical protein
MAVRGHVQDPCAGRVWLADGGVVVAVKGDEEATVILDCWIGGGGDAIRVQSVAVRFIIALVSRVVDQDSIRSGRATHDYTVHGVGL